MASEPEPADDRELLRRYLAGHEASLGELIKRHHEEIYRFFYYRTRSREFAEELTQDVFLKLVTKADSFRGDASIRTWLFAIARNRTIDHIRRQKFRRHRSLDQSQRNTNQSMKDRLEASPLAEPSQEARSQRLAAEIAKATEDLPPEQKEVFLLRHGLGMSFPEIAVAIGINENTAKSRLRYALRKMQSDLADYKPNKDKEKT